jgi:hypothetical protein
MLRFRRADAKQRSKSKKKLTNAPEMAMLNRECWEAARGSRVVSCRLECDFARDFRLLVDVVFAAEDSIQMNGTTTSVKRLACTGSCLRERLTAKECGEET